MLMYCMKRLAALVPMLLIMSMCVFGLSRLSAGDPARVLAQQAYEHPTPVQIELVRHEYGLDLPLVLQYGRWLGRVCRGDFGPSYQTGKPAIEEIAARLPATVRLAVTALVLLVLIAVPLGVLAAVYENRWPDRILRVFSFVSVSTPSFWIGLMLLYWFGVRLKWIPIIGSAAGTIPILPALTLDIGYFGVLIQLMRTSLIRVLNRGFVRAARARGLPEWRVVMRHGLKNAILPVITQMSQMSVGLLCGSAVIESIFAVNGIGRFSLQAVYAQDLPVLQCFILLVTAFVILMNLAVDILYAAIDVRIHLAPERERP